MQHETPNSPAIASPVLHHERNPGRLLTELMPRYSRGRVERPCQAPFRQRRLPQRLLKRDVFLHAVKEKQHLGANHTGRARDGGHCLGVGHLESFTRGSVAKGKDNLAEKCEASYA